MQGAGTVIARRTALLEAVDETLRKPLDDLVALLSEEAENRQSDCEIAAQITAALDKHYLETLGGSGLRRHQSRRTSANDEDVNRSAHGNFPSGFVDSFNLFHIIRLF